MKLSMFFLIYYSLVSCCFKQEAVKYTPAVPFNKGFKIITVPGKNHQDNFCRILNQAGKANVLEEILLAEGFGPS
jgi:hypothetical protein